MMPSKRYGVRLRCRVLVSICQYIASTQLMQSKAMELADCVGAKNLLDRGRGAIVAILPSLRTVRAVLPHTALQKTVSSVEDY